MCLLSCQGNQCVQLLDSNLSNIPQVIQVDLPHDFQNVDISFTILIFSWNKFSICSLSPLGSMSSQTFNNFLPIKFLISPERMKDIINKYTKSLDTATQILKLDSIPMNQHDSPTWENWSVARQFHQLATIALHQPVETNCHGLAYANLDKIWGWPE